MKRIFTFILLLLFSEMIFAQANNLVFQESYSSKDVWDIKAQLTFENIIIEQIYGNEVLVEVSCNNLNKVPSVMLEEHQLFIESQQGHYSSGNKCTVYIYIPQEYTADSIHIESENGNITCENLLIKNDLILISKSGTVNVDYASCEFLRIMTTSGSISGQQLLCDFFKVNAVDGDITLKIDKAPLGKSSVRTATGNISLFVPDNADFELVVDSKAKRYKDKFDHEKPKAPGIVHKVFRNGGSVLFVQSEKGHITVDEYK